VIQSIRHKGLRLYYEEGDGSKLPASHLSKIARLLTALDAVSSDEDVRALGSGIHRLKGSYEGFWALSITPNYRIIFRFKSPDVFDVDYLDYH
jgi:proteic killer suppression protein